MFTQPISAQSWTDFREDVLHKQVVNNSHHSNFVVKTNYSGFVCRASLCHMDGFPQTAPCSEGDFVCADSIKYVVPNKDLSQRVLTSYPAPLVQNVHSAHTTLLGGISVPTLHKGISSPVVDPTAAS